MKSRYFIHLSYDGTNYHGWQIQPNALTVQECLNKALTTILREPIEVIGAGRTDTGVHATCFYAHFESTKNDLDKNQKLVYKLNGILSKDIAIYSIIKVNPDDHSRFTATSRTYHYYIHQFKDPFKVQYSTFIPFDMDINLMNEAALILYNYKDFTSFSKLHSNVKTNNCSVTYAKWEKKNHSLIFTITADRFLRNMVRAIVGTLIEVGKGSISLSQFEEIIKLKDRSLAKSSAPAKGLFLTDIRYPDDIQEKLNSHINKMI